MIHVIHSTVTAAAAAAAAKVRLVKVLIDRMHEA